MLKKFIKDCVLEILERRGRRITRNPTQKYFQYFGTDCVLDVGANKGQFAMEIRKRGYRGRIESFEPLSSAMSVLKQNASLDPLWKTHAYALGSQSCTREINVSANQPSSSFLQLDNSISNASTVNLNYVSTEMVQIRKLDDVYQRIKSDAKSIYLKIDTQGFEKDVILGASDSLRDIKVVQMELPFVANYQGEALVEEMISLMRKLNLDPWWVVEGFKNFQTLQLYQVDVFFVRRDS